jgi:hypothetical protein
MESLEMTNSFIQISTRQASRYLQQGKESEDRTWRINLFSFHSTLLNYFKLPVQCIFALEKVGKHFMLNYWYAPQS